MFVVLFCFTLFLYATAQWVLVRSHFAAWGRAVLSPARNGKEEFCQHAGHGLALWQGFLVQGTAQLGGLNFWLWGPLCAFGEDFRWYFVLNKLLSVVSVHHSDIFLICAMIFALLQAQWTSMLWSRKMHTLTTMFSWVAIRSSFLSWLIGMYVLIIPMAFHMWPLWCNANPQENI